LFYVFVDCFFSLVSIVISIVFMVFSMVFIVFYTAFVVLKSFWEGVFGGLWGSRFLSVSGGSSEVWEVVFKGGFAGVREFLGILI